MTGDHAEGEVDRARQRGVDDREQNRRADAAAQRHKRPCRHLRRDPLALRRGRYALSRGIVPGGDLIPGRAHDPRLPRLASRYSRPPPAAMNSTPSSRREEMMPPCPSAASTISPTPMTAISSENINVAERCACRPVIFD